MADQVTTPAALAGSTFKSTIRDKAAELKRELIRQTLDDIESWRKAVDVQWQREHPGEGPVPISEDEIRRYQDSVRTEFYEWVEPAFERHLQPDPDAINPMIAALRGNESMFGGSQDGAGNFNPASPALARVNDVRTDIGEWQGDLQIDFVDNFLTPLQTVSLNQASVAKVVREHLECSKVMYIRYRKGILNLVTDSIEAVRTLNNGRDPKSYMWGTLVGIAVGTGLTLATGGLAVGGAVLIISSTLAQGLTPDPPRTYELSAPTAQEVAIKISEAMAQMESDVESEERKIRNAFTNICDTIADSRSESLFSNTSGPLAVATPDVSTAKPGDITDGSLRPND